MRRAVVLLVLVAALAGCGTVAFAAGLGVTATSLTTFAAASTVPRTTCSLQPTSDTYVDEQNKNRTHEDDSPLLVSSGKKAAEALLDFYLSCVPAGGKIASATLTAYLSSAPGGGRTYGAYAITSDWTDGTATWRNKPSTSGPSSTDGASGGTLEWDVTSDVRSIAAGGSSYGWAIADVDESNGDSTGELDSRDDGNPPTLTIEFWR